MSTALNISWSEAFDMDWKDFQHVLSKLEDLRMGEQASLQSANSRAGMR